MRSCMSRGGREKGGGVRKGFMRRGGGGGGGTGQGEGEGGSGEGDEGW